jgi:hypothetical protein
MVHAYLMYGYPTQTIQETIDSLEMVRQMFELGIIQSGFWHQFAMTAHSPVGMNPEEFGVIPEQNEITFANNDIHFKDKTGIDHDKFSFGLKKSLFNFMHGICLDYPLQDWFDFKIPQTNILPDYIANCLEKEPDFNTKPTAKIIWIGGKPSVKTVTKSKKGQTWQMTELTFHTKLDSFTISIEEEKGKWLLKTLDLLTLNSDKSYTYAALKSDFEAYFEDFELFWYSKSIQVLRQKGLLVF